MADQNSPSNQIGIEVLVVQMETKTMKAKWLYGGVLASAIAIPAFGQISVSIGTPPPPIRYEVRPAMPSPGYVWVDGYWGVNGGRYVWVPGVWRRPPYAGAYWSHPHYDHYNDGWHMHEGHWDHEDHGDHHEDHHGH
jgi:WXXGXW repeat (2 copies)